MNVLYTFDVEVYFGTSGSTKISVYENTMKIIETLNSSNVTGIFFIDATHMFYSFMKGENNITDLYLKLIKKLREFNHDIGLHLHPHWLDAKGSDPTYEFQQLDNYSTGYVATQNSEILNDIISNFINIVKNTDPTYNVNIFRAGGYCAQPPHKLFTILAQHGIWIDSSVVPQMSCDSPPFQFDYSEIKSSDPYFFKWDNAISDREGTFIELPVFSFRLSAARRIFEKFKRVKNKKYAAYSEGKGLSFSNKIHKKLSSTYKILTTDDSDLQDFEYALNNTVNTSIIVVNHPKLLSEQGLINLKAVTQKYPGITLSQLTNQVTEANID